MGARQSAYLVDAHEPQPHQPQQQPQPQAESAPASGTASAARAPPHRPPPLNLAAPPAPVPRRRAPICSALDTVDIASTHPHSPIPSPAATGLVDVWIIAGQSNAVGENAPDGMPIPAASQPMPGLVLAYDSSGKWRDAVPNIHAGIHGFAKEPSCGPAISFGRTLVSLGLSGRVGLVPAAKGATNLFHDWRPAGGGDLYGAMIARTKAALAAPLPAGGSCRLRGMIWVQGEADAEEKVGPGPSEAYGANFSAFVQAVRRDLASYHPQLPIIVGVMALRKRDCFPYLPAVRRAQLGVPVPGLLRVDLAGYEFFEEYGDFHVHLTKDGAAALGASMAHTYYSAVVRAGLPRRPGDVAAAAAAVAAFALATPASSGGGAASGGGAGSSGAGGAAGPAAAAAPPTVPAAEPAAPPLPPPPPTAAAALPPSVFTVDTATAAVAVAVAEVAAVAGEEVVTGLVDAQGGGVESGGEQEAALAVEPRPGGAEVQLPESGDSATATTTAAASVSGVASAASAAAGGEGEALSAAAVAETDPGVTAVSSSSAAGVDERPSQAGTQLAAGAAEQP